MHRQLRFVIWFPIVLVTAFAAGYLFWQQTLIPGPYDLEPMSVVRNHRATGVDTNNWQTYRNEKYGFEIKYPLTFSINEGIPSCNKIAHYVGFDKNGVSPPFLENSVNEIIEITIYINDPDDKCVDGHYSLPGPTGKTYELVNSENLTVNGNLVLKRNYIDDTYADAEKLYKFSTWRFKKNNNYFTIIYNNGIGDPEPLIYRFNAFLSTFKFIEPGSKENKVCIQVITKAKNPQTGEIRDFPTPCEVPEDWELVR